MLVACGINPELKALIWHCALVSISDLPTYLTSDITLDCDLPFLTALYITLTIAFSTMSTKKVPRAMEISQMEVAWISSTADKSAEAYFRAFELNEKLSAYRRYMRLIEGDNTLSDVDKKTVVENFEWWKTNKGHQFWTDRRTHLSTMRTTGALFEAAEPYAD
jgi:hypothetical protein